MSCLTTASLHKEHGTATKDKPGVLERGQREGGDASIQYVLPTSQNPLRWNPSWLREACTTRKDPEWDQTWAKQADWPDPETNPITIKPDTLNMWQSSSPGLPYLPAGVPLPNKVFCCVYTCVSSDNSFLSVRQKPTLRPWNGFPFLQHNYHFWRIKLQDLKEGALDHIYPHLSQ